MAKIYDADAEGAKNVTEKLRSSFFVNRCRSIRLLFSTLHIPGCHPQAISPKSRFVTLMDSHINTYIHVHIYPPIHKQTHMHTYVHT